MKDVEVFTWLMPAPAWKPKAKPYRSRWKMSADEAATYGAISPCPETREIRQILETPEEIEPNLTSGFFRKK